MHIGDRNDTNETKEKLLEILRNSSEVKEIIANKERYAVELDKLTNNAKITIGNKSYEVKDIIVAKSSNYINIVNMIKGIDVGSGTISEAGDFCGDLLYLIS